MQRLMCPLRLSMFGNWAIKETSRLPQSLTMRTTSSEGMPCSLGTFQLEQGTTCIALKCSSILFISSTILFHYCFVFYILPIVTLSSDQLGFLIPPLHTGHR